MPVARRAHRAASWPQMGGQHLGHRQRAHHHSAPPLSGLLRALLVRVELDERRGIPQRAQRRPSRTSLASGVPRPAAARARASSSSAGASTSGRAERSEHQPRPGEALAQRLTLIIGERRVGRRRNQVLERLVDARAPCRREAAHRLSPFVAQSDRELLHGSTLALTRAARTRGQPVDDGRRRSAGCATGDRRQTAWTAFSRAPRSSPGAPQAARGQVEMEAVAFVAGQWKTGHPPFTAQSMFAPQASGFCQFSASNRAKSASLEHRTTPCSMASAASIASGTRFPRTLWVSMR